MGAIPTFFSEGNTPRVKDTRWRILQKILGATLEGGTGAGTDYNLEFAIPADLPAAPPDTTKVWSAWFRNGSPSMHWSPTLGAWV